VGDLHAGRRRYFALPARERTDQNFVVKPTSCEPPQQCLNKTRDFHNDTERTLTLGTPLRPLSTCFISAPARQSGLRIEIANIEPTSVARLDLHPLGQGISEGIDVCANTGELSTQTRSQNTMQRSRSRRIHSVQHEDRATKTSTRRNRQTDKNRELRQNSTDEQNSTNESTLAGPRGPTAQHSATYTRNAHEHNSAYRQGPLQEPGQPWW
jgi:hypothetical protein